MKYILAVDIGTTSAKALVVSQNGEILATSQEFYKTGQSRPDFAEQDPDELFKAVCNIIRESAGKVNGKIDGVCFSSAMHSLMAVDKNGAALTPLIIWADLRSKYEALELLASNGQLIYEETGTPIHSMSPLCKLLWLKKNESKIFTEAFKFIGIREYIGYKFFGEFSVDHSVASATGLFHTSKREWSLNACNAVGLSPDKLSNLKSVYTILKASPEILSDLGLPNDIPWILGASDGCLANLGSGAMQEDILSLTIGTSGAVRKATRNNFPDPKGRTFNYLLDEERLITGGATNNGAILVQWFAEKFLKEKVNVRTFAERASVVAPGADGLLFLPYILGERAPVFDPEASGVFIGMNHQHTIEHFMRAILEGVGYALFSIAKIVQENSGDYSHVMASGGFVKSPIWVQIITDIFGKDFTVRGTDDASSLGAALLGFKALGLETAFQFPNQRSFVPHMVHHKKYDEYFSVYKNLYSHLSDDFHRLNHIAKS